MDGLGGDSHNCYKQRSPKWAMYEQKYGKIKCGGTIHLSEIIITENMCERQAGFWWHWETYVSNPCKQHKINFQTKDCGRWIYQSIWALIACRLSHTELWRGDQVGTGTKEQLWMLEKTETLDGFNIQKNINCLFDPNQILLFNNLSLWAARCTWEVNWKCHQKCLRWGFGDNFMGKVRSLLLMDWWRCLVEFDFRCLWLNIS